MRDPGKIRYTVLKFKNFPPGNLFFVSTVEKFEILEYRNLLVMFSNKFHVFVYCLFSYPYRKSKQISRDFIMEQLP